MSLRKSLTPDLVASKTRCDNLFLLKNLNLWGNDIEDVRLLRQMPNLEILSLSVNKINSLKEFSNCPKLQELYLRKNNISDLSELRFLSNLNNLRVLWLLDNPCAEVHNYREIVIKALPNIAKLDNCDVSKEERAKAQNFILEGQDQNDEKIDEEYNENQEWNNELLESRKEKTESNLKSEKNERNEIRYEKNDNNRWKIGKNEYEGKQFKNELSERQNTDFEDKKEKKIIASPKDSKLLNDNKNIRKERKKNGLEDEIDKKQDNSQRKENVLCAVLALLKELDYTELDFIKRDIERKLGIYIFFIFNLKFY